jgi:hypothetical protein
MIEKGKPKEGRGPERGLGLRIPIRGFGDEEIHA